MNEALRLELNGHNFVTYKGIRDNKVIFEDESKTLEFSLNALADVRVWENKEVGSKWIMTCRIEFNPDKSYS